MRPAGEWLTFALVWLGGGAALALLARGLVRVARKVLDWLEERLNR